MSKVVEDNEPDWLMTENDEKHRNETVPLLFGDGSTTSQAHAEPPRNPPSHETYGATGKDSKLTSGVLPVTTNDDNDDMESSSKTTTSILRFTVKKKQEANIKKQTPLTPRSAAALRAKPHMPRINPCLYLFHLLQGIAIIASLMLMTTQLIPVVFARGDVLNEIGLDSVALKIYISSFCLIFIAAESDLPIPFLRDSNLFQGYFSRGFLYSFLGLICLNEAYSVRVRSILHNKQSTMDVGWAPVFMQLSSWLMLGVGVLYMMLGVCCMKSLRDRMKEREKRDWQEYNEALKAWKELYT